MQFLPVLNYSDYFLLPIPVDHLSFLRNYPTDYIILKLSKINTILFQEIDLAKQTHKIFDEVIFAGNWDAGRKIAQMKTTLVIDHQVLFAPASLSLLIKSCLENFKVEQSPDEPIDQNQFAYDLFKTILIFNQIFYNRTDNDDAETFEGIFKLEMQQQNYMRANIYFKQISHLKFAFISKFFSTNKVLREANIEFCQHYQIGHPWHLGKFFMDLLNYFPDENAGKNIVDTTKVPHNMVSDFIIDKDALKSGKKLSFTMDVVPKPFYLIKQQHALIMDYSYFQYIIDQGIFYLFYQNTSLKNNLLFKNYNSFKTFLGLEFFEKYLVGNYMNAMFYRKNQKVISQDRFQDFIIKVSTSKVLIIETKMTDLHAKTIENMDFSGFKSFLDKNFLSEKSDQTKDKGVAQLARQLENLSAVNSELRGLLGVKSADRLSVYPILIYSDSALDISGVNSYINDSFLKRAKTLAPGFRSLKPVVMININTIIKYHHMIKKDPDTITDWIDGYFKRIFNLKKKYEARPNPYDYLLCNKSFTNYLRVKIKDDKLSDNLSEMEKNFDFTMIDYRMDDAGLK